MKTQCAVDGCERDTWARGWCGTHYNRARLNSGDPGPATIRQKVTGRTCGFEGCTHKHDSNGLCTGHNRQRQAGQELRPLESRRSLAARDAKGNRLCSGCRKWLSVDQFHTNRRAADNLAVECIDCKRDRRLLRSYGLTLEQYETMLAEQKGGCAICGGTNQSGRALAVDHDHNCCPAKQSCGKCVRALLCSPCNQAIGLMQDQPQRLRDAADYLERF